MNWQLLFPLVSLLSSNLIVACGSTPADSSTEQDLSTITLDAKPEYVLGVGRVEPEGKIIDLYPQSDGVINKVNVKLGDKVLEGQVLFSIDSKGAIEQISVVAAQIEEQQANIQGVQIDIDKAKVFKENANKKYLRIKSVYDKGAETISNLELVEAQDKAAKEDVRRLESNLQFEKARLKELEALLRSAQSNVGRYSVKAPADGQILAVEVALGSSVTTISNLGTFAPISPTVVVTEIDELYASLMALNQQAYIRQQGSRDTVAWGYVIELSPALKQKSLFHDGIGDLEDRRVREAKIRIEKGMDKLIYGARVEAVISINSDSLNQEVELKNK